MALDRNKLAALWLCYVTKEEYADKLNRPIEDVLADTEFVFSTGLDEEHIRAMHERIHGNQQVNKKLTAARQAFLDVFLPSTANSLWDSSSPTTDLIARVALGCPEE